MTWPSALEGVQYHVGLTKRAKNLMWAETGSLPWPVMTYFYFAPIRDCEWIWSFFYPTKNL